MTHQMPLLHPESNRRLLRRSISPLRVHDLVVLRSSEGFVRKVRLSTALVLNITAAENQL